MLVLETRALDPSWRRKCCDAVERVTRFPAYTLVGAAAEETREKQGASSHVADSAHALQGAAELVAMRGAETVEVEPAVATVAAAAAAAGLVHVFRIGETLEYEVGSYKGGSPELADSTNARFGCLRRRTAGALGDQI